MRAPPPPGAGVPRCAASCCCSLALSLPPCAAKSREYERAGPDVGDKRREQMAANSKAYRERKKLKQD